MKIVSSLLILVFAFAFTSCSNTTESTTHKTTALNKKAPQKTEPWTAEQLMPPADLAKLLNTPGAKVPVIFNIGPSGVIKTAITVGSTRSKQNVEKLRAELKDLPKDTEIVVYCGCCPFGNCPNIRPAFNLLNDMGFTNHKLLNLSSNLKTDWINYNYPM